MECFLIKIFLLAILFNQSPARRITESTNTDFIRSSCSTTTYPQLCYTSLSAHATLIQQNPKLLATTALSVSLEKTRLTSADITKMSHTISLTPREAGAMKDCVDVMGDSVDELRRSITEMNEIKGSNVGLIMSDVQTWVSAALTDEDTCMEGFKERAIIGQVKIAIRERILTVVHMTSNALALINTYASLHG